MKYLIVLCISIVLLIGTIICVNNEYKKSINQILSEHQVALDEFGEVNYVRGLEVGECMGQYINKQNSTAPFKTIKELVQEYNQENATAMGSFYSYEGVRMEAYVSCHGRMYIKYADFTGEYKTW